MGKTASKLNSTCDHHIESAKDINDSINKIIAHQDQAKPSGSGVGMRPEHFDPANRYKDTK